MNPSDTPKTETATAEQLAQEIRLYLASSDAQLSAGLLSLLRHEPRAHLIGTSDSLEQTLSALESSEVDVLVLDVRLGEGESLEAIHDMKEIRPRMKVLVTTNGRDQDQQVASILAGAHGFLYQPFDLAHAIALIHAGKVYFDAGPLAEALNPPPPSQTSSSLMISDEEREFLGFVRQGLSNAEIAKRLNTEIKAVYQRRFRLKSKLKLGSARALASFARELPFKRILVVDDEPMVRQSVKIILQSSGHTVETAADAPEALKKLEYQAFDLIVADLRLPGMQGDELARQIKSRNPSQRVILLTGFPPDLCPPEIDLMLLKPFSVVELRKAVA